LSDRQSARAKLAHVTAATKCGIVPSMSAHVGTAGRTYSLSNTNVDSTTICAGYMTPLHCHHENTMLTGRPHARHRPMSIMTIMPSFKSLVIAANHN
jgi:hypothetical protein